MPPIRPVRAAAPGERAEAVSRGTSSANLPGIVAAMTAAGAPMRPGDIERATGLSRNRVKAALALGLRRGVVGRVDAPLARNDVRVGSWRGRSVLVLWELL